jgi:hypothetical protein
MTKNVKNKINLFKNKKVANLQNKKKIFTIRLASASLSKKF